MVRYWNALDEDHQLALKRQGFVPMTREECLPLFPDDYGIRDLMAPHLQGRKFPASYVNVRQHLEKKLSENEADSFLKELLRLSNELLERVCVIRAAQPSFRLATPSEV